MAKPECTLSPLFWIPYADSLSYPERFHIIPSSPLRQYSLPSHISQYLSFTDESRLYLWMSTTPTQGAAVNRLIFIFAIFKSHQIVKPLQRGGLPSIVTSVCLLCAQPLPDFSYGKIRPRYVYPLAADQDESLPGCDSGLGSAWYSRRPFP